MVESKLDLKIAEIVVLLSELKTDILDMKQLVKDEQIKTENRIIILEDRVRKTEGFQALIKGAILIIGVIISVLGTKILGLIQ